MRLQRSSLRNSSDVVDIGFVMDNKRYENPEELRKLQIKCVHGKWEHYATLAQGGESLLYANFTDRHSLSWTATNAEVFPVRRIAFGDIEVNIPNDCDAMLRRGYGDYMAAPPEKDRKNHCPSKLDFGEC